MTNESKYQPMSEDDLELRKCKVLSSVLNQVYEVMHKPPAYQPMSELERCELSHEAGRELTEHEAYQYRLRKTQTQAVYNLLDKTWEHA